MSTAAASPLAPSLQLAAAPPSRIAGPPLAEDSA